ncbi:laccase-1-like, partial [Anneissia japonica]|uniref:laccase-1-like n=1 Tax=Anneissia japonica TaxID=1529436 RepID=UPI00142585E6
MRANVIFIGILVSQVLQAKLGSGTYSLNGIDCKRQCKWPAEPAVCRFNFTIDWYYSMSKACYDCPFNLTHCKSPDCIPLNGVKRGILVANKQFPGPSIEVCEGDTIEVEVINNLPSGEGTALHWHGL